MKVSPQGGQLQGRTSSGGCPGGPGPDLGGRFPCPGPPLASSAHSSGLPPLSSLLEQPLKALFLSISAPSSLSRFASFGLWPILPIHSEAWNAKAEILPWLTVNLLSLSPSTWGILRVLFHEKSVYLALKLPLQDGFIFSKLHPKSIL